MKEEDLKNGKFTDEQGREQLAVPLSSIFKMVGGAKPSQPKPKTQPTQEDTKPKAPIKRGIKLPK